MTNLQAIFSEEELDSLVNRHPAKLAQMLPTPECIPELMGVNYTGGNHRALRDCAEAFQHEMYALGKQYRLCILERGQDFH